MNSKILFCGDTHGPLNRVLQAACQYPDYQLIHLGDLSPLGGPLDEILPDQVKDRFWFIPGNHDYDQEQYYDQTVNSGLANRNLHGRVVDIDGVRVAGLGGNFLAKVWNPNQGPSLHDRREQALLHCGYGNRWRGGLPRRWRSAIFKEDFDALSLLDADVLVCHEAPSCHRYGFAVLDDLAEALGCRLVVHGHHHEGYQSTILQGGTRVMGVGYRGISDFQGAVIRAGDYDLQ